MGPGKIAAVYRVQVNPLKPLAQIVELVVAPGGESAVILAVGHTEEVALRLGVAYQKNFGNHNTGPSLQSDFIVIVSDLSAFSKGNDLVATLIFPSVGSY